MPDLPLDDKLSILMALAADDHDASGGRPLPPRLRNAGAAGVLRPLNLRDVRSAAGARRRLLRILQERAESLGVRPLGRWVASGAAGLDPRVMGLGPVGATRKALARAGIGLDDVGLVELNEAFAVQAIAVMRELGLREELTNVNGGAIALGHPLGCSGARVVTTLLHEMQRRAAAGTPVRYGLATLCVGVGQGEAAVFEPVPPGR
jgi:acetyl-CoA acetyltransferase